MDIDDAEFLGINLQLSRDENEREQEETRETLSRVSITQANNLDPQEQSSAEQRHASDQQRIAEAQRADEQRRVAEERRRLEEQRLAEQQQAAEAQRAANEQRRVAEERRIFEERRLAEQQRAAEAQRAADEQRRIAEQRRCFEERRLAEQQQAGDDEKRPLPLTYTPSSKGSTTPRNAHKLYTPSRSKSQKRALSEEEKGGPIEKYFRKDTTQKEANPTPAISTPPSA